LSHSTDAAKRAALQNERMTAPKIPMNLFAIPFGLAGLSEAWSALSGERHAPAQVADTMTGLGTPDGQFFINALRATEQ